MVTPSYMLAIAEEFLRQGLDPAASSLRIGIFGAEPWSEAMRAEIETRIGIERSTSTGCRRSWARGWPVSARRPRTGR